MIIKQTLLTMEEVQKINQLREVENRTFSNMLRVLIQKALKNEVVPDV